MYFLVCVSFRVSEGKKRVNMNCFYYPTLCLCGYSPLYPHSLLYSSVVFFSLCYVLVLSFVVDAVFFADLPILLPSMGISPFLCVIIHLGVFRVSEAKNLGFML